MNKGEAIYELKQLLYKKEIEYLPNGHKAKDALIIAIAELLLNENENKA